jgi:hypothetical protein
MISVKEILVEKYDSINYEPCVSGFNFHFENSFTSFNPTTFQPSTTIPFSVVVEGEKYIDKLFLNHNKRNSRDYVFNKFVIEVNEKLTKEFIKNQKQFNSRLFNGLERDVGENFDLKEVFFKFLDINKESLPSIIENFVEVSDFECQEYRQNLISYNLKTKIDDYYLLGEKFPTELEESIVTKILGEIIIMFLKEKENDSNLKSFGIYEFFVGPKLIEPNSPFIKKRPLMVRILKQYK